MTVSKAQDLGTQPIGKLLLRFAAPSIVAMLVMSLYNIVDQLFIGHGVGFLGNAATNVVFPINILAISVSMLIGEGGTALYSIRLGEKRHEEARQTVGNAVILLSCIGVLFATFCLLFLKPLLGFFGATPAIMPYALDYAGPIVWGLPFMLVAGGLNALTRANGSPAYAMKAMITGAIINTVLDPLFIFTFGMGVKGAALATAIAQVIAFFVSLTYIARGHFGVSAKHFRLAWPTVTKILACGVSSSISQLAIMVVIVAVNKSLVLYGTQSKYGAEICLAAHGITMKVNQILFSFLLGISMGAQPIIGYNFGAKNYDRVKKTFRSAVIVALSVGIAAFAMYFFFPQYIIRLFGNENDLYNEFSRKCFRIFLFFTFLNGFTLLAGTFFQAMAKPIPAAAIQLSRQIVFMIPALHILPLFFGLEGVLLAGPCTDLLAFMFALGLAGREYRRLGVVGREMDADESLGQGLDALTALGEKIVEEAEAESARVSARFTRG